MFSLESSSMYRRVSSSGDIEQKKKLVIWATCICSLVLLLVLATTISLTALTPHHHHSFHTHSKLTSSSSNIVESACQATLYPTLCQSALTSAAKKPPKNSKEAFDLSVQFALANAHSVRGMAYNMTQSHRYMQSGKPSGMDDCLELLDISVDQLNDVLDPQKVSDPHDIDTWLSAAMTNQATCMDSLQEVGHSKYLDSMSSQVQSLSQSISNSLALHQKNLRKGEKKAKKSKKPKNPPEASEYPAWMTVVDRKLLEASPEDVKADAVVAGDGNGTHRTIGEALAFVSLKTSGRDGGSGRTVIYIKAGVYNEYIRIPTKQKNVMLMGDGKGKTVIVGSKNVAGGSTTYQSATVGAMGAGFIAKGLTIINNSGPEKNQGVALRVGADISVIYQCSIQGYQDTLYTHSNRQFYRDNDIYGTVDFIFGNAAAVIQNCLIQPRKPSGGQRNSITAQGRRDPNQNTGLSIHNCKIAGSSDLSGAVTYLGRPWHQYSRTVFMGSYLDGSINSAGWEPWSGSFALSTLYYGEYANTGPGSSISGRVKWPGVHSSLSDSEASKFTVSEFISGDSWLPGTGVDYTSGL